MQIKSAKFIRSYSKFSDIKQDGKAEFAFIGRSNVGKSSLINYLANRKNLAKTSSKPGKTQLINQFLVNENWYLIDLPGYGYAKVSKKQRSKFQDLITDYLENSKELYCAFVLIDSRIPPQKIDLEFMEWCAVNEVPIAVVFTKTDKLSTTKMMENTENFKAALYQNGWDEIPTTFVTSAAKRVGSEDLIKFIDNVLAK
jgi:GTP-binding protein